jgi:rare lipoprotein A
MIGRMMICFVILVGMAGGVEAQSWTGEAAFYTLKGRTASGGHPRAFTAAHRTLPLGSKVRVTNLRNNRSVVVIITDRGPSAPGHLIDVSKKAAKALQFRSKGVAPVRVDVVAN